MFSVKSTRLLLLAIVLEVTLGLAVCSTATLTTASPAKLTPQQKVASVTSSDKDIAFNTIPGASDQYVPDQHNRSTSISQLVNYEANSNATTALANTTNSQANVFEATAQTNLSQPDPLQVNAQQQNPFLSNVPGGINPQIAMMLQNNPRLQMLARQNPIVAQQIMRNPQLLRDPQIQRAIQSQMGPGQGQSLLGRLGQSGLLNNLGRALNPLGLPIGINPALLNRQQQQQQQQQQQLNNPMNRGGLGGQNQLGGHNNQVGNNFGLPRSQQPVVNPHRETLPGGYYGNNNNNKPNAHTNLNENASPAVENTGDEGAGEEGTADPGNGEGAGEGASPDYDGAGGGAGEGAGGEEENPGAGADDSQQNPSEDPDIQQLQNFGGPVGDNFPEGLFPPGLLTQDDINEIRKQQEKQAKEAEEKERQQQQAAQGGQGGTDYEDNGGDGSSGAGEEVPTEGAAVGEGGEAGEAGEGATEGANGGEHAAGEDAGAAGAGAAADGAHVNDGQNGAALAGVSPVQGNSFPNANPAYANSNAYNPVSNQMQSPPAAYKNSYQPIQPMITPQRMPLQPSIEYANPGYPVNNGMLNHQPMGQLNQLNNNQLGGYQPGVQYDDPNQLYNQQQQQHQQQQQFNPFQLTTTPSPISQQYGVQPPSNPLLQHFNGPPHPSQFANRGYNNRQQPQQSPRPWQAPQPYNGGLNFDPRRLQGNRNSMANFGGGNGNAIPNDDPYRSNVFNQQRPAFQQRPRGYMD